MLYPTREETAAAIARNRERLARVFRVPTPGWETVRWAWDKRNTYRLAEEPESRRLEPGSVAEQDEVKMIDGEPPFAVKPAIKEHFIYATKAKAWRADSKEELAALVERRRSTSGRER